MLSRPRAERGDEGQPWRGRAGQLGARIVEQDAARLRRHELVGALEDLAQRAVEPHVPAHRVLVAAPRAHEEARDLLGRQREDRPGRRRRVRHRDLFRAHARRHARKPGDLSGTFRIAHAGRLHHIPTILRCRVPGTESNREPGPPRGRARVGADLARGNVRRVRQVALTARTCTDAPSRTTARSCCSATRGTSGRCTPRPSRPRSRAGRSC